MLATCWALGAPYLVKRCPLLCHSHSPLTSSAYFIHNIAGMRKNAIFKKLAQMVNFMLCIFNKGNRGEIERGKVEAVTDFLFLGSKIIADGNCSHEIRRCLLLWSKAYDKPRQQIKKQRQHFANKRLSSQSSGLSSSHVWMSELDHKEGQLQNSDHWRIDAFELWCWEDSWESLGQQDQTSQS